MDSCPPPVAPARFLAVSWDTRSLICLLLLSIVAVMVFLPVATSMVELDGDYAVHISLAQRNLETGSIESPHFLFQFLVIGFHLMGFSYASSAVMTSVLSYVAVSVILFLFLLYGIRGKGELRIFATASLLSLALQFVFPISFFSFERHSVYLGYLSGNSFHNPTILLLKPLALLLFWIGARSLVDSDLNKFRWIAIMLLLTILSAVTKPSLLICLVPAMGILGLAAVKRGRSWSSSLVVFGVFVPAVVVLGWQYYFTYVEDVAGSAGIIFAPFQVMSGYSSLLLPKFLLSTAFPILVWVFFLPDTRRDRFLGLAWLSFGVACFYTYFLAESGQRIYSGNFGWSAEITLFLLFVASGRFLWERLATLEKKQRWVLLRSGRLLVCLTAFLLHLFCGILFYALHLTPAYRSWW